MRYWELDERKFRWWVKELFPLKNGNLIVKLEDYESVDDHDKRKSITTMQSRLGSYIFIT